MANGTPKRAANSWSEALAAQAGKRIYVVVDLDGTLLRDDKSISAATRHALEIAATRNIEVIPATARAPYSVIEATKGARVGQHAITLNGSSIWDLESDAPTWSALLPPATAGTLLEAARRRFPGVVAAWEDTNGLHYEPAFADIFDLAGSGNGAHQFESPSVSPPSDNGVNKLILWRAGVSAEEITEELLRKSSAFNPVINHNHNGAWVELLANNAHKGKALHWLMRRNHVELAAAVGDGPNDLPLLDATPWFFAVGNATPEVLRVATEVLPTNQADGVALLLQTISASREVETTHATAACRGTISQ